MPARMAAATFALLPNNKAPRSLATHLIGHLSCIKQLLLLHDYGVELHNVLIRKQASSHQARYSAATKSRFTRRNVLEHTQSNNITTTPPRQLPEDPRIHHDFAQATFFREHLLGHIGRAVHNGHSSLTDHGRGQAFTGALEADTNKPSTMRSAEQRSPKLRVDRTYAWPFCAPERVDLDLLWRCGSHRLWRESVGRACSLPERFVDGVMLSWCGYSGGDRHVVRQGVPETLATVMSAVGAVILMATQGRERS